MYIIYIYIYSIYIYACIYENYDISFSAGDLGTSGPDSGLEDVRRDCSGFGSFRKLGVP